MNMPKLWPALLLIIAYAAGYMHAQSSAEKKAGELLAATQDAISKQAEQVRTIFDDYKKKLDAANSKPARTITERVYIKADCSAVPTDGAARMDNEGQARRVELAESTLRSIERVTKEFDDEYRETVYALRACIDATTRR